MSSSVALAPPLSPTDKNSFAYKTVKDRLPVILGKVIDAVYRSWEPIKQKHGQVAEADVNEANAALSRLHYQLQTNKPLEPVTDNHSDQNIWNAELEKVCRELHEPATWFESPWLFTETFMYRKINEALFNSKYLKDFDPFYDIKLEAFKTSIDAIKIVCEYIYKFDHEALNKTESVEEIFHNVMKMALWGNKCDLSLTNMSVSEKVVDPLETVDAYDEFILRNDLQYVWNHLRDLNKKGSGKDSIGTGTTGAGATKGFRRIDLILDNAGFELFTDFVLANFFLRANLVDQIVMHGKAMPWFVSDVIETDFYDLLKYVDQLGRGEGEFDLEGHSRDGGNKYCHAFTNVIRKVLDGQHPWSWGNKGKSEPVPLLYKAHDFWTLPNDYNDMERLAPDLYQDLSLSDLLIFKGDLNFRKLTGDRAWPHSTPFRESIRSFRPAPLVVLRTIKCETVVGLSPETDVISKTFPPDWMLTGDYAIIEFDC